MNFRYIKICMSVFFSFVFYLMLTSVVFGGTPHTVYGTLKYPDGTTPSSATFLAYITLRPDKVLRQSDFGCSYSNGTWSVQCGNFASPWSAGEVLHVDLYNTGKAGSVEVTLTNEPSDNAGITLLTSSSNQVKLLVYDMDVSRGTIVDVPVRLEELGVSDSVMAYQMTVNFDPDVLIAVGATNEETMTDRWGDPYYACKESEITVGGFTTNQPSTRLIPDYGILVKLRFLVQGIQSSQTSNSTLIRFKEAYIVTYDPIMDIERWIYISHTKNGVISVLGGSPTEARNITLYPGWNLVSLSIAPNPNSITEIFGGIQVDYIFGYNSFDGARTWDRVREELGYYNDLKYLNGLYGYWIKTSLSVQNTWNFAGDLIPVDTPIPLYSGWNLIGYIPTVSDSISHSLESLENTYSYIMGIEQGGGGTISWDRERDRLGYYNDLNVLKPLSGYWVKIDSARTLLYPSGGYRISKMKEDYLSLNYYLTDTIPEIIVTPFWCDFYGNQGDILSAGDTIEVFDSDGILCGRNFTVSGGSFVVHAYGDDPNTQDIDEGAAFGDTMRFSINGDSTVVIDGDNVWAYRESKYIELAFLNSYVYDYQGLNLPSEFSLIQNYPNPFNAQTIIYYRIHTQSEINLYIFNIKGKVVRTFMKNSLHQPGQYKIVWDGTNDKGERVSSGVYLCNLQIGNTKYNIKMVLIY